MEIVHLGSAPIMVTTKNKTNYDLNANNKRRPVSVNKVQGLHFGSILGSDASKSARFSEDELVAEFKPPAPVAAKLTSRDPTAQPTKADAFKTGAAYKKISVWMKTLTPGGGGFLK